MPRHHEQDPDLMLAQLPCAKCGEHSQVRGSNYCAHCICYWESFQ
jgi:hypothetical protein